jgi:hypothetical protein
MLKRLSLKIFVIILVAAGLQACNEPPNPLIGKWRQASPVPANDQIIVFTPSTMQIDDRRVTVVYQFRDDQVRVSASKEATIYTFTDPNTITYEDDNQETVTLSRITP